MAETLTLTGELDRQMKSVRKGESSVVVCPWHGKFVNLETGDCCIEMSDARAILGRDHLASIDRQFAEVRAGTRDSVSCPYCDCQNRSENLTSPVYWKRPFVSPYCCPLMDVATVAIGERVKMQALADQKRRLEDSIAKAGMN